ncbi:MAG: hypothetical protein VW625_06505 [Perlucidibaca sp.]
MASLSFPVLRRASWLALLLALLPLPAVATNGYFAHGYSASQRALGGAGTANASDALILTINPAGSTFLGERWDANLSIFVPIREYETGTTGGALGLGIVDIDPGRVESEHNVFGIPGFAYVVPVSERASAGLAIYGNGGMNTVYKAEDSNASFFKAGSSSGLLGSLLGLSPLESRCTGTFGGGSPAPGNSDALGFCGRGNGTASVDLIQLFIAPNYAYRLGERTSIGISPIIATQRFAAKGLQAFAQFSNSPDHVSDQGYSFSYGGGGRLGLLTELLPGVDFGASWQSRIYMTPFKEYRGLFAEGGDFDIPSSWNVGLALRPTINQRILLDYQRINFSEIASVGNSLDPNRFVNDCALARLTGSTAASPACLGADTGPGFGWQDIGVYKVGYQLTTGNWSWRLGYSRTHQPIPDSEVLFNILAPGVVEQHYTAGMGWQQSRRLGFDLSLMYAPPNPVRGKNPLSNVQLLNSGQVINADADANDQDITLNMRQYELTLGVSYTY